MEAAWLRHRRSALWVVGFVVVVWVALTVTAPAGPRSPAPVTKVSCPPSAPNAAAGCLTVTPP